jgi:hypothetical protein
MVKVLELPTVDTLNVGAAAGVEVACRALLSSASARIAREQLRIRRLRMLWQVFDGERDVTDGT